MTFSDDQKKALTILVQGNESFFHFASDMCNRLAGAILSLQLPAESKVQEEMHRERAISAIKDVIETFREVR